MDKELVRDLFFYKDGMLFWRRGNKRNTKPGMRAGCINGDGYRLIRVNKVLYGEHRLVYLYHHGYLPALIDHIDRDKGNNNIENLREADKAINSHNRDPRGSVGYRGVTKLRSGKFMASIVYNGTKRYLGVFDNPEAASKAYEESALLLYG